MTNLRAAAAPKSDQKNADDFVAGPKTFKIVGAELRGEGDDLKVWVYLEGEKNPYKPCKSMVRVMFHVWGDEDADLIGQSLTLYCDPEVRFGGAAVGGIRISHMTGLKTAKTMKLTASRGSKKAFTVQPLNISPSEDAIKDARKEALVAAQGGKVKFLEWYNSDDGKRVRKIGDLDTAYLQSVCANADAANEPADDDTFPGDRPSQNQGGS